MVYCTGVDLTLIFVCGYASGFVSQVLQGNRTGGICTYDHAHPEGRGVLLSADALQAGEPGKLVV